MIDENDNKNAAAAAAPAECCGASRRRVMGAGLVAGAGALVSQLIGNEAALADSDATLESLSRYQGSRILLKGGTVLSVDPKVGNFESADVLIQGKKILAVGPNIDAAAVTVDAKGMIVMPGFVDTHHHQYEDVLRSILSDGVLSPTSDAPISYISTILGVFTPLYTPEDAYLAELVASLSQINDGVTTTVDTSQVNNTPAHTDALIQALKDSGRRAVFAYSAGSGTNTKYPQDIVRVQKQYFGSKDQLLTLAMGGETNVLNTWALARSIDVPIVSHVVGSIAGQVDSLRAAAAAGLMGPDNEYIHCTELPDDLWQKIADTGGKVSIAPAIEMEMRHGMPAFQAALDHKVALSLSVDVECSMTSDLFSIMRSAFTLQRALLNERSINGETNLPPLLTCYDTIKLATIGGATVAHLDKKIGTLTPGKQADIIMLDANRINVFPLNNVPGAVVTLMDTSNVDTVFIAGQVKKWQGKLVGVDVDSLRHRINRARDNLLARANFQRNLFGSCCEARGPLE